MTDVLAAKRAKLESHETTHVNINDENKCTWTIKAILSDEYDKPIKCCFVCVCTVNDTKIISTAMRELCQKIPLTSLNHLKRVNKTKIILCSLHELIVFYQKNRTNQTIELNKFMCKTESEIVTEEQLLAFDEESITTLIKCFLQDCNLSISLIELLTERLEFISVAASAPILNWQYSEVITIWPCKFHPNKQLEKLYANEWFTNDEITFHIQMIEICEFLQQQLQKNACGIAIDPRTKSIVAIGFDEMNTHPLMHCAMVLIDAVARSQNGGAWNNYLLEETDQCEFDVESNDYTMFGTTSHIRTLITSKFPQIKFGAEHVKSVDDNRQNYMNMDANCDNLAKYGPYLATGYDVYLWREPCVMCSMALTHSRIRTIFFHKKHPTNGAICSHTKLQSVKSLNHHFQVFHITKS